MLSDEVAESSELVGLMNNGDSVKDSAKELSFEDGLSVIEISPPTCHTCCLQLLSLAS